MNSTLKTILPQNRNSALVWIGAIALAFVLGLILTGGNDNTSSQHNHDSEQTAESSVWTCSMHPNIQQPKPGKCPICGMDLIPIVTSANKKGGSRQITLSENARKLAQVEVVQVERKSVSKEIRLVGKIEVDESRVSYITARFPGRIEKIFVDFTGTAVKKNDPLVEVYSPEIVATQLELFESLSAKKEFERSSNPDLLKAAEQQLGSVKDRLRLWGLTDQQIAQLEQNKEVSENITLYSTIQGVVIEKQAVEGKYVTEGTRIYTIVDLSKVWLQMDAYESDLLWLKTGQKVEFHTEAYPGKTFEGKIAFIDPVINLKTRTVKVRVNVNNSDGALKPEMLAHAVVKSELNTSQSDMALVIPATAPLITGKRAIVYVELPENRGTYEGREITLGPRADNYYVVESGLEQGELVVSNGNFKIDSAIQIQGRPSMMNPDIESSSAIHDHSETIEETDEEITAFTDIPNSLKEQLDEVYAAYFEVQYALSHDQFEPISKNASSFLNALKNVDMILLSEKSHHEWMKSLIDLKTSASGIEKSGDIENARTSFDLLSKSMIRVAKLFGSDDLRLLVYHCPMAFDFQGADWLQNKEGTENPYFGSSMFSCGEQTADLTSTKTSEETGGHKHE